MDSKVSLPKMSQLLSAVLFLRPLLQAWLRDWPHLAWVAIFHFLKVHWTLNVSSTHLTPKTLKILSKKKELQKSCCLSPCSRPKAVAVAGLTAACAWSRAFRLRPFFANTELATNYNLSKLQMQLRHIVHLCQRCQRRSNAWIFDRKSSW